MFGQIKLKKNAWHVRLHKFTFGDNAPSLKFTNFCPYFWLTIFCMLIFPVVGTVKGIVAGFRWFGRTAEDFSYWADEATQKYICKPMFEQYAKNLSKTDIVEGSEAGYGDGKKLRKKREAFQRWRELNPDWKEILAAYKEEVEKERKKFWDEHHERQKAKAAREEKRRKLAYKLAAWTKAVAPVFITIGILLGVSLIGAALYFLSIWAMTWPWIKIAQWTTFIAVLGLLGLLLYFLINFLKEKGDKCLVPFKWIAAPVVFCFKPVQPAFKWLGRKIMIGLDRLGEAGEFFTAYIKAAKDDHCPAIKWED